jgi:glucose/arabinose dehydrogenase
MIRKPGLRSILLAVSLVSIGTRPLSAQTLPAGFVDSLVASVGSPTDIGFLPDGRMLITTQTGTLRVYCPSNALPGCGAVAASGGLLASPAINFGNAVCTQSERGLLGVAVDPNFGNGNTDIFLFYTANKAGVGCKNRVSRFVYNTANNSAGSETILVDNMLSTAGNHNAGDVKFGKDGLLYISIGDGGCDFNPPNGCQNDNLAARNQNVLTGKILRVTRDGGIPPNNPWAVTGGDCRLPANDGRTGAAQCKETFSWGHRNPFRFAFDPNAAGTRFFINEVGTSAREEINEGAAGQDFGWSCREGTLVNSSGTVISSPLCNPQPAGMVDPIFEYPHGTIPGTTIGGANCITGGAFVPNGVWPAAYNGLYLVAEYGAGAIFKMTTAPPYTASNFASGFGGNSVTSLRFGPYLATQALYYTTYAGGVHRITTSVPTAVASSDVSGGPTPPVVVTFSGAGSSDPAGLPLTYNWDFGDGSGTQQTSNLTIQHAYSTLGTFTATLRVSNGAQTSGPATVVILVGTTPPGTFYTVTPCRIVDTRGTAGVPIGGPALAGGPVPTASTRAFTLTNNCGIPAGVKAVALNITVVGPSQAGDLRLFPTGGSVTSSNLNFAAGQTRANNATVKISAGGQLSVTCDMAAAGSTHFLLDVLGFFE